MLRKNRPDFISAKAYRRRPEVKAAIKVVKAGGRAMILGGWASFKARLWAILFPGKEYPGLKWDCPLEYIFAMKIVDGWTVLDAYRQVVMRHERHAVIKSFREAEEKYTAAMTAVSDYFSPLIKNACECKDFEQAMDLVRECPCPVARAFGLDTMRQAGYRPQALLPLPTPAPLERRDKWAVEKHGDMHEASK